jgi:3-oxo-5-alpha-steroid 4-dehydrogenase 1
MNISPDTYRLLLYAWMGIAVVIFFVLLRIKAPYGRHSSMNWGPQLPNHIGWAIMEAPAFLVMTGFLLTRLHSTVTIVIALLFCVHYFNRSFVFPFRLHTKGKKMPVMIVASAICFNLINVSALGYWLEHFAVYPGNYLSDPRFIGGIILFITGAVINGHADNRLIQLRKPGETDYKIPRGWLFEFTSCPNLLGELIEWSGFAILCWNLPAVSFLVWTAANLVPRALAHHRWYRRRFTDYPPERKALIPFLF